MNIVEINTCNYGSTGNIMMNVAALAQQRNHNVYTCCPDSALNRARNYQKQFFIGKHWRWLLHSKLGKLTGLNGCFSYFDTLKLINNIKSINPNIIHLHNLHGFYINIPLLFKYIKKHNISVVWTLHDCWSFTGHCPHFDMIGCDKWKTGCFKCPIYKEYPASFVDNSKLMYRLKKSWFTGVKNMTLVTPSKWLANLIEQSILREYPIKVINNGIDLTVFKPIESDFKKRYNCENKYIVLGVAFGWDRKKGLDVFIELSKRLDARFQIVLVGTNESVDRQLPANIISIHRTQNQSQLAEIYTAADLFVNPTREENYPTVNMEAIACGTPVLTFNTGGSPECIDNLSGTKVDRDDLDALELEIKRICEAKPYSEKDCIERASQFCMNERLSRYVDLYEEINN